MVAEKSTSAAKKATSKKASAKKAAPAKKAAAAEPPAKTAAKSTPARKKAAGSATAKAAAKKAAPAGKRAAKSASAAKAAKAAQASKAADDVESAKAVKAKAVKAEKAVKAVKAVKKKTASAKTTGAKKVVAKKSPAVEEGAAAAGVPGARVADTPGELAVRPGEDPWTPEEVAEARRELGDEAVRLRAEIIAADEAITGLMRDGGAGAGDDQADTGTKNIEREHGLALAAGARERLSQTERALERLDAGTYGLCESCGKAIGKARMQAFPRATLCVECKQRQERR